MMRPEPELAVEVGDLPPLASTGTSVVVLRGRDVDGGVILSAVDVARRGTSSNVSSRW